MTVFTLTKNSYYFDSYVNKHNEVYKDNYYKI